MSDENVPGPRTERLRPGVYATRDGSGVTVMAWPRALALGDGAAVDARLRQLVEGGPGGVDDPVTARLREDGWLVQEFEDDDGSGFAVRPLRAAVEPAAASSADLDLSRFAVIRRDGADLLVESPLASAEIVLHRRSLLADALSGTGGLAAALRRELRRHGFLALPGGPEDTEFRYRQWAPHELLFHDRSRQGHRGPADDFGGTWWGGTAGFAPERAAPVSFGGRRVALPPVDLAALRASDPPYAEVVECRASLREHDDAAPIDVAELGELLYRTARVRGVRVDHGTEVVNSPRPSGGSLAELELYLAVSRCAGLEPAFYHYDAHRHELEEVCGIGAPAVRRMVQVASGVAATGVAPQVLIVVSARVGRVMGKYQKMGFELVLKDTGVLYQALAGACSAMGLAGCPLGTDDPVAFAEATGRDPLLECSVGQFIVGSSPRPVAAVTR
ncbi:SagB family peptide dehydrogenase [Rathayibacter sp. VKM Ac-2856]|uniref:SagB family peptide dehydrogenase n=1 Tax=unclassified Rathayibacter TaxID=2609250 RepID=UPI00156527F8|nr:MULTISPECIES: SagB family peptide dehydrogenase [unclassified Rathayibacter]NQX04489.1 SagB family peptide dehydrogenase [Rathayibacter sp. VKM Ac-2858]NQX19658.1 SagB family peptide dehydrogenase [Rathayibacter sp. VKM Ac-2856]